MSPDEVLVALVSAIVAIRGWYLWYLRLARLPAIARPNPLQPALLALPAVALGAVYGVLRRLASWDVRVNPTYLLFYLGFGAAWLVAVRAAAARIGVRWIDDAVERSNPAAVAAMGGVLLGGAACYAGGNVGDGPGWWCVLIASGLATLFWLLLWYALERLSRASEAVTVDRDLGAGLRLGAWLLASGLIAGRAAAGDWIGLDNTLIDFARSAWPAVPLAAVAAVVEWRRARRPVKAGEGAWLVPSAAIGLAYLAVAIAVVVLTSLPEQNPAYGLPPAEAS